MTSKIETSAELQDTLIDLYRRDPKHAEMCERLVDLDEGLQEWRYRHVKMVQRTIGAKMGTGGSAGAQYLATTLMTPIFPDLWEIRSRLYRVPEFQGSEVPGLELSPGTAGTQEPRNYRITKGI